jgi:pimeloyl-ACP methyl ester carboxylesterase
MGLRRWYGLKRLVFDTFHHTTSFVQKTEEGVAERTLRKLDLVPPVGRAARAVVSVQQLISRGVYASIRGVGRGVDAVTEIPFRIALDEETTPDHGPPLDSDATGSAAWIADSAQAALTGFFGDRLEQHKNPLAESMSLRHEGQEVQVTPEGLRQAFPEATGKLVVLVHGLTCTEWCWSFQARERWGDPRMNYGAALARDLKMTPLFVRYNSGRHISDNGWDLAELLGRLIEAWPVPVKEISLLGHSMGGLVARSAAHQAAQGGAPWVTRLRRVIAVGSPHLGAPLEKAVNAMTYTLKRVDAAGAQVPAQVLDLRSAGIKDLRFGYTIKDEWKDRDPDALLEDNRKEIPLLDGVAYAFVASTLARDPKHPVGSLLGDLLVRLPSATGQHPEPARRVPFHLGSIHGGISHLTLANHPDVYEVIRGFCSDLPRERAGEAWVI